MNWVKLTTNKLNVESIYNLVSGPEFGAISLFVGTTRDNFEGKIVTKLEYEAYEQMAIKSLENICHKIRENFDVGNIAIFHRLGDVPIQEASVVIAISSSHRTSALKAVPYAIDALKSNVPIWKKEIYGNGLPSEWKENSEFESVGSMEKSKASQLVHLYEEVVETDSGNDIPSHLIQVKADLQEINRRINSFIYRKRQQINESNIENFCLNKTGNFENTTCARVSAILKRRTNSKSHLKVHRVANIIGPQTDSPVSCFNESLQEYSCKRNICPTGAEERLCNVESYLDINQHSNNVFARLKMIEDKILYLESISPEYFGWEKDTKKISRGKTFSSLKRTYSASELDSKMQELELKLQKKSNFNA